MHGFVTCITFTIKFSEFLVFYIFNIVGIFIEVFALECINVLITSLFGLPNNQIFGNTVEFQPVKNNLYYF